MLTNEYLKRVYEGLAQRNANEPEFLQAVREVLESIQPVVEKHPAAQRGYPCRCRALPVLHAYTARPQRRAMLTLLL